MTLSLGTGTKVMAQPATGRNVAWVWRFDRDGAPEDIARVLAAHGLGITLKTHDGVDWAGSWDKSGSGVNGAVDVHRLAEFFESRNVPFHAWSVVQGTDARAEAQMASQVLNAGARSMTFDLEPPDGRNYWLGKPEDARAYGEILRSLQPNATLMVAPDARPWQLAKVPMAEFAAFSDRILPQTYWRTFDSPTNLRMMRERGFDVSAGMTPELILDAANLWLKDYGKPIDPVGQGDADGEQWNRFLGRAQSLGMQAASAWRYGTANQAVWPALAGFGSSVAADGPSVPVTEPASVIEPPAPPQRTVKRLGIGRWLRLR